MHRLLKSSRILHSFANKSIVSASRRSLPALYYYSTTTVTEDPVTQYRHKVQQKSPELWQAYSNLKHDLTKLKREEFLELRADLWKQSAWGTEDRILQVLDDMKQAGHEWQVNEYNEYFMAKLFKAQYKDILDMYNGEFKNNPVKMKVGSFNVILATYIQLGQIDDAIQLIRDAKTKYDVIPDIRDFDRTMHRCMPKNSQINQTAAGLIAEHAFSSITVLNTNLLHLFERKRTSVIKWIYEMKRQEKLDITSYNILIKGYCDTRLFREAMQVYSDMGQRGVKPNTYICASLLSIYAHTRDVASAEEVVRETIRGGYKPDISIYNQLIKVYFKGRQAQKAFHVFSDIQKDPELKLNAVILNTMVDGLVINNELKIASMLYEQMMQSEFKPDLITCNTMLKGYTKAGDTKSAAGIISDMHKLGMEPDTVTYTTLIDSVFKRNQPRTAQEMMTLVAQMGMTPNVYTFNAVINSWIQNDRMEEAEKTLQLMKQYSLRPSVHTFTNLIQGYVEQMNLQKAMETFQRLIRSGEQPDRATFNFMIVGFLNHERLNDAYICLERMITMKLSPTKDTWKLILEECCRKKDWTVGQKVVKMLDQSGFVIKSESLKLSYTKVKNHCK